MNYRIFITSLYICLSTLSFGQSRDPDFSSFKNKFQPPLRCPCQFGETNCKSKLNQTEIVKFLFQEIDENYDSIENSYYCAEHMLIFENFFGFFYSHKYNENVDVSLATFSTDGKFINSQTLGTDYEFSTDYSSFSSSTLYKIESKNIHVTNISTKIGLHDTINDADSTITKSSFTFKYGRIRKIKESITNNTLSKFYSKFKSANYPLTIKHPNEKSKFLQKNEIESLLKVKVPSKWGIENYRAEYIFKSETFTTLIYSHRHNENGHEVTDILMSTFLKNGRLNETKVLATQYEKKIGDYTHYSSFEIIVDSAKVEVKKNTFKKLTGSNREKASNSSVTNYTLDKGFINNSDKTDFKSFCEKFELIDISKNMKWDSDKPPYLQGNRIKTFLNIDAPADNELQYYKANYILKLENTTILFYSQINGKSNEKYSDIFMSTFSDEGELIDTQLLGTYYNQNHGKYTHISSLNVKVNSTTVNVSNATYTLDNEPYDCTDANGYEGSETVYTLKKGIISSKPTNYLR